MSKRKVINYKSVFLSLIFLVTICNYSFGQFKVYGIVTTEENKKYHGEVITYEPLEFVKMNCQGDTLSWNLDVNTFKFSTRKPPKKYNFPVETGYHRISLGSLISNIDEGGYISYTYTHQKSLRVGYGGGLSFENYNDDDGYDFLVPRATFTSYLRETNATPYFTADLGYGIALKNEGKGQTRAEGGINFGASLGYRLSSNQVMIDFSVGSRFQKGYFELDKIDFVKKEDILFKRMNFSIGFMW